LFRGGRINYEEALKNADSKNNLRLRIQLSEGKEVVEDDLDEDDFPGGLSLMSTDSNDNQMF
jgi:Tfp pilus assembly ATPase PilU